MASTKVQPIQVADNGEIQSTKEVSPRAGDEAWSNCDNIKTLPKDRPTHGPSMVDRFKESLRTFIEYRVVNFIVTTAVLTNVCIIVMESKDGEYNGSSNHKCGLCPSWKFVKFSEVFYIIFFSAEFLLRLVAAERYWVRAPPLEGSYDKNNARLGETTRNYVETPFFRDPFNYCDFLSFFPAAIGLAFTINDSDLRFLKMLRLMKIFRNALGIKLVFKTLRNSTQALLIPMLFLTTLIFFFSVIIYTLEGCEDVNTCNFESLYNTMYFTVVTVTTVGYGDQSPDLENYLSLFVTVVLMILGITCELIGDGGGGHLFLPLSGSFCAPPVCSCSPTTTNVVVTSLPTKLNTLS
jgi:hypothetical protein